MNDDYCLLLYVFKYERIYTISFPKHLNPDDQISLKKHKDIIEKLINESKKKTLNDKLKMIINYCLRKSIILWTGWSESKRHNYQLLTIGQLYVKLQ